jgi:hypothetical protein
MLYFGTLLKIYCKEIMYSMLEAKLQNCPLTSLNKYVYNGKSEIKVYMRICIYIYIYTHTHTHTQTHWICMWKCWYWIIHLLTKNKRIALTSNSMPFQNNGLEVFGVKAQIQQLLCNLTPSCLLIISSFHSTNITKNIISSTLNFSPQSVVRTRLDIPFVFIKLMVE